MGCARGLVTSMCSEYQEGLDSDGAVHGLAEHQSQSAGLLGCVLACAGDTCRCSRRPLPTRPGTVAAEGCTCRCRALVNQQPAQRVLNAMHSAHVEGSAAHGKINAWQQLSQMQPRTLSCSVGLGHRCTSSCSRFGWEPQMQPAQLGRHRVLF